MKKLLPERWLCQDDHAIVAGDVPDDVQVPTGHPLPSCQSYIVQGGNQ